MEGILKYSALNPLATCFVPSNLKKAGLNKTGKVHSNIKDEKFQLKSKNGEFSKAVVKFKTEVHYKGNEQVGLFLSYPTRVDFVNSKHKISSFLNENVYFTKRRITPDKTQSTTYLTITDVGAFLRFLLLTLLSFYYKNCAITYDAIDTDEKVDFALKQDEKICLKTNEEASAITENCCPPMFGCIIPPSFFGNPFNLGTSCTKKCVHVCHYTEVNQNKVACHKMNYSAEGDFKNSKDKTNLNKYSCNMGEIIKDVSNIASFADDFIKDAAYVKRIDSVQGAYRVTVKSDNLIGVDFRESPPQNKLFNAATVMSCERDNLNLDNLMMEMEIPKDTQTFGDDDFHPLLDEGISMESCYEGVSPVVEEMIESRFTPRYRERLSFDPEELPGKTICDPPCSVWCDSLPQPAKDTYRKFMRSLSLQQNRCDYSNLEIPHNFHAKSSKPSYKRSFSANDCSKRKENINPIYSYLHSVSGKRTSVNNDNNGFKLGHSNPIQEHGYLHLNNCSNELLNSSTSNLRCKDECSGMWGPFDGADSLWQPLPDCVQAFEPNVKQGAHRRVRELKRQMSLS